MSLRRESARLKEGQDFWRLIRDLGVRVLPNTAGCHSVKEAVTTAQMAREIFGTPWIKLEVIGEADTLQPDVFGLVEAARILARRRLRGVPLYDRGSRRRRAAARGRLQGADAVGRADRLGPGAQQRVRPAGAARPFPRHAADRRRRRRPAVARRAAMELGYDGVLLNTAVAKAGDPSRWRAPSRRRSRPAAPPSSPDPCSRATWPRPRRRSSASRADMSALASLTPSPSPARRAELGLDPFYPIVDSAAWVGRLVGVGARLVQLRIKDRDEAWIARETREALAICAQAGAILVVNDYWRVAIDEGADWVHLGQGDLDHADVGAIRKAGLQLGVCTHDEPNSTGRSGSIPIMSRSGRSIRPFSRRWLLRRKAWSGSASGSAGSARFRWSPSAASTSSGRSCASRRGRGHRLRRHRHHAQRRPGGARARMDRGDAAA